MSNKPHVLIAGAGMTGLLLAQKLKSHGISFSIYERDPSADCRGGGWGLAIHWALDVLLGLLPEHLREQIPLTNVDPDALAEGKVGRFPFFNLVTGDTMFENVNEKRVRLQRQRLRNLMLTDLDVQWSKTVHDITQDHDDNITIHFTDGSQASGTHLVGCDGSRSRIREKLCGRTGESSLNHRLDIRLLGASAITPADLGRRLQEMDTYFFQGGDRSSSSFMFWAVQDTPTHNDRKDNPDTYACQIIVSWPYRAGFLGQSKPIEIPTRQEERLNLMKQISQSWASPFRDAVYAVPADTHIQAVNLESWKPAPGKWDNLNGRATLIGDAAHTMTMFRGEAFNHGILDVEQYTSHLIPVLTGEKDISSSAEACSAYESSMAERTRIAVDASNQACLDAHSLNHEKITKDSPVIKRRMGETVVAGA